MGVTGLQSFLEGSCVDACRNVKIATLLEEFRRENGYISVPSVVVDGTGCLRTLYGHLDWVCGGQMKEFKDIVEKFVLSFKKLNVRLVFFFDGPTVEEKRPRWIQRRVENMKDIDKVFRSISETPNRIKNSGNRHLFILPPGVGNVARFLFKIEFGCEVHVSVKECDEEIAEYARKENSFAILAQDTDFVILEGAKYYLSMGNLRLNTMETKLYDRTQLAVELNIDTKHLPLLATLMGNDIVEKYKLSKFHTKIGKKHHYGIATQVALYIKDLDLNDEKLYETIADFAFEDKSKSDIIKYSVDSYSSVSSPDDDIVISQNNCESETWKNIMREALKRHRSGLTSSHVWAIINDQPFELSAALENYRSDNMPFAANLYCPLRQRIYGLLLKEKPLPEGKGEHAVSEWVVVPGFGQVKSPVFVSPIYPKVPHPGLLALWNDKSEDIADQKWNLFVNAVSEKINGDELRKLDEYLIIPALAIYYMIEHKVIDEAEAKAFIAMTVVVSQSSTEWLSRQDVRKIDERAVRLATLYMRAFGMLLMLVTGIGEPIPIKLAMPWSFDGKFFQIVYDSATRRREDYFLCNKKEKFLDTFYKVCAVVFDDPEYKNRRSR